MSVVIFAEKPSQAKAYAEAFNIKGRTKTHIEINSCSTFENGAIITWGIGHLVELKMPGEYKDEWKKWKLSNLPIFPERYEFKVSEDKKQQFYAVKELFNNANLIVNATDIDREGSNIFYSTLLMTGAKNKKIKRLWINSLEVDEIRKGFNNLKDNKNDLLMYHEAKARQIGDWLVGMNLSPLYSLILQKKGFRGSLSIGRVQTPTVYMIYQRQKEIKNFVSKPFYEIHGMFYTEKGAYKGKANIKCNTKDEIEKIYQKHELKKQDQGYVQSIEKKERKKRPPKLHSLSTLQTKANKIWKYSPSSVLKTVQKLYEKKLITYPRTDCNYITDNEFGYLIQNVEQYKKIIKADFKVSNTEPDKRYVDNKKVEEHYALIPTKTIPDKKTLNSLSVEEKNIYYEILRTSLAMFHSDYIYEQTIIITNVKNLEFKTTGNVEINKGWKELFSETTKKEEEQEINLPNLNEGENVKAEMETKKGMTTPPKPYTEGQLINLMKTAGKLAENETDIEILKEIEGIGTEATRASIIERIKEQKYIEIKKNIVHVTKKGEILCRSVEGTLLSSPSMTAKWEEYLRKIGRGTGRQQAFINNTIKFIEKMIDEVPKNDNEKIDVLIKKTNEVNGICKCPSCNGQIVDRNKFYGCTGYSDGCKISFPKKIADKNMTKNIIKTLCTKRETGKLKGFKSKKGNSFDSKLKLNDEYRIEFIFD